MVNNLSKYLEQAKHAAYEIGKLQLKFYEKELRVIRKTRKELVCNVDMECQQLSYELLAGESMYPVLSEEVRNASNNESDYFWVVDPLDGSHNFIAGLPIFGVSIALMNKEQSLIGVVYLPIFDKLYYAIRNQGAYMNGQRVYVSNNKILEKSMITYDNMFHPNFGAIERFANLTRNVFTMRIFGSAIYDFSLIATGKIDARIWNNTKMFDFAAGVIIVEEAGGRITDFEGNAITLNSKKIIASNALIHDKLLSIINNRD